MNIVPNLFSGPSDRPLFGDEEGNKDKDFHPQTNLSPIKLLIIDDEEDIHRVTEMVLADYHYRKRPLQILNAYSANHAKQLLEQNTDVAVILLDVVMESEHAGLDLVDYIRNVLDYKHLRIILRTGQPGQAPEMRVIQDYDINDYREKSELTAGKLISAVTSAIRSYLDITTIEKLALDKSNLKSLVEERTRELEELNRNLDKLVKQRTAELEVAKEKAEAASQAKSQFLSRVSHELRTPMNAILGFAQLMDLERNDLSIEHVSSLDEILKAGRHLLDLINELIEISRIETGNVQLNFEQLPFCSLVNDVLGLMQPMADKRGIALYNHALEHGDVLIETDKTRLRQVLINLITNAIKYNRKEGRVSVSCMVDEAANHIRIEVEDTGIGISDEDQERIFQPFLRVDDFHPEEGSGVGLSVCKQIVEVLDGEIGVESKKDVGSTFWFTLPIQRQH